MASGCVPIGSAVGAIPEIIGDTGMVLTEKNSGLLNSQIDSFSNQSLLQFSQKASQRIAAKFNFEKRKKALLQALFYFFH
jgi:glycosyltransferase involved in cell wall biosynthesis